MPETHILVVDDEVILRNLLQRSLTRAGYRVYTTSNGHEALVIFAEQPIHLVLVDGRMPGMDGFALCEALRSQSDVPIIMVTSLDNPDEVIRGFGAGADDYITKPFQFREVETRIASLLRRANTSVEQVAAIDGPEFALNSLAHELLLRGQRIPLSPIEYRLLEQLVRAQAPLTAQELSQAVWGQTSLYRLNLIERLVDQIRSKIEPDPQQPHYLQRMANGGFQVHFE